jgi:hypothetical protein
MSLQLPSGQFNNRYDFKYQEYRSKREKIATVYSTNIYHAVNTYHMMVPGRNELLTLIMYPTCDGEIYLYSRDNPELVTVFNSI